MKLETVEEAWRSYADAIYTDFTPSKTQYDGTRRAFQAGVCWMMTQSQNVVMNRELSDEQVARYLQSLSKEIMAEVDMIQKQAAAKRN